MSVFYEKPTEFFVKLKDVAAVVLVNASGYRETDYSFEFQMVLRMDADERRDLFLHVPPYKDPQDRVPVMVVSFPKEVVEKIDSVLAG